MPVNANSDQVLPALLARHRHNPTRLVQILREAQEALGWLSPQTLGIIAAGIDLPFPSSFFVTADAASPTGVRYY